MVGRTCWAGARRRVRARGAGGAGEVEQVRVLSLVQLQRPGQGFQHAVGDAAEVAPLQLGVVLHADAGQVGDLAAAQPRHAPVPGVRAQPGLLAG